MKRVAVIAVPLMLSGCGGPIELTLLSFAGDAVSYLTSGKSTTDHAISAVSGQDCALHRSLKGEEICREEAVEETGAEETAVALWDDAATTRMRYAADPLAEMTPVAVASPPPFELVKLGSANDVFLVLASGRDSDQMKDRQRRLSGLGARVVTTDLRGAPYYKVVTGPYRLSELDDARRDLAAAGVANSWAMRADAGYR